MQRFAAIGLIMWGRLVTCSGLVIRLVLNRNIRRADFQSAAGFQPALQTQEQRFGQLSCSLQFHPDDLAPRHARLSSSLIKPFDKIFREPESERAHLPKA